jgi:hypothetical protein
MHKNKSSQQDCVMAKEGLHELAYKLTLDPAEEVRSAFENVSGKSWAELQSLENIVVIKAENNGLEAQVSETPIVQTETGVMYHAKTEELPENYKSAHDIATNKEDDAPDIDYSFSTGAPWAETRQEYEKSIEASAVSRLFHLSHEQHFATKEEQDRAFYYKLEIGFGWACALYALAERAI